MPTSNLWSAQIEAIGNLEKSLAANKRRSGKTYTAVNFVYRFIKLAGARRLLFLVDRGNLGDQTLKEFQQFVMPDDGRKFTELYNVQHLTSNHLDPVARVTICTIQRLYAMLRGLFVLFLNKQKPQGEITRGDRQRFRRVRRNVCIAASSQRRRRLARRVVLCKQTA
jgi:type I restriction enzyme, R subunit